MRVNALLGSDKTVIPLQFLHIPKSPFFDNLTNIHFSILLGFPLAPICSEIGDASYMLLLLGLPSELLVVGRLVLVSFSSDIFGGLLISAFEGRFVLTFNNISAISLSGLFTGGYLFRITLKYFFHLDRYSTSLFKIRPSFFTGFEELIVYC